MLEKLQGPWELFLSILTFVWNSEHLYAAFAQRILLILPVVALVFAVLATILALATIVIRQNRREFTSAIFVTWWDLGKAIFLFWGGIIKFVFDFVGALLGLVRIIVFSLFLVVKDLLMVPVRLVGDLSQGYSNPGIPWPAVAMMLAWTVLEALIFTFVMTPLVTDVLSGFTGKELEGLVLQVPLYLTFLVFVLGSYAVLYTFQLAAAARDVGKIIFYLFVEFVVAIVEVIFLYREFVDALVPWFAQHAGEDFHLGVMGTIGIAFFVWLGIRAMTWFLFGSTGIPTLMAIIQRTGLDLGASGKQIREAKTNKARAIFTYIHETIDYIKKDFEWVQKKGEDILSSFIIPPLQIIAACINFCTLIVNNNFLFVLPLKSYKDIMDSRSLLVNAKKSISN